MYAKYSKMEKVALDKGYCVLFDIFYTMQMHKKQWNSPGDVAWYSSIHIQDAKRNCLLRWKFPKRRCISSLNIMVQAFTATSMKILFKTRKMSRVSRDSVDISLISRNFSCFSRDFPKFSRQNVANFLGHP